MGIGGQEQYLVFELTKEPPSLFEGGSYILNI